MPQVEMEIKYEGYMHRERTRIHQMTRMEKCSIPVGFDYMAVQALSREGREKLTIRKPSTLGQAARIPGISPSDISVLMVEMGRYKP